MTRSATTALVLGLLLSAAGRAPAQWGNLKGQVVFDGDPPPREKINVNRDAAHCLGKGPILSEKLLVDARSKGVKNVMVWLVDPDDPLKVIGPPAQAVNAALQKLVVDNPSCRFEPHVLFVLPGQSVTFKNPAPVCHNVNVIGPAKGPNVNVLLQPGRDIEVKDWAVHPMPAVVRCAIHPWMGGYIRTVPSPYFAVTDDQGNFEIRNAPAGNFRLILWQEEIGWVKGGRNGVAVTVKKGATLDLGTIKGKLPN
jgi:plastocyanin